MGKRDYDDDEYEIDDLIRLRVNLDLIKPPTEELTLAKTHLENIITSLIQQIESTT